MDDSYLDLTCSTKVTAAEQSRTPDPVDSDDLAKQLIGAARGGYADAHPPSVGAAGSLRGGTAASLSAEVSDAEMEALATMMERLAHDGGAGGEHLGALRRGSRTRPQRELLRPDHVAASRSKYGAAAAGEEYEEEANAACELCSEPFFSASGKSALCLTCRELPASRVAQRKRARTVESGATSVASSSGSAAASAQASESGASGVTAGGEDLEDLQGETGPEVKAAHSPLA